MDEERGLVRPFAGQGFISTAVASAIRGKTLTVFGECGSIRDHIYNDDLVEGMVVALEHGVHRGIYNIGSSIGRSNLEVLQAMLPILDKAGIRLRIEHLPARSFDVNANVLDCQKLRKMGWMSHVDLKQGWRAPASGCWKHNETDCHGRRVAADSSVQTEGERVVAQCCCGKVLSSFGILVVLLCGNECYGYK